MDSSSYGRVHGGLSEYTYCPCRINWRSVESTKDLEIANPYKEIANPYNDGWDVW